MYDSILYIKQVFVREQKEFKVIQMKWKSFEQKIKKLWQINYNLQSQYKIKNYVIKAAGKCSIFLICVFFCF
ncbi:unnamed protein product [Paramecium primaurelia]|uniref:Uncharacterized protein n=1 Tax=Paramecium primaurelia TaxID=5886 RepID=A0A8S1KKK3_PARPR|nr:unnamed protein product [Paramecium primaurelia]